MKQLHIGMIGAGAISAIHMHAYQTNPYVRLFGIYDVNELRATEKAKQFQVEHVYTSVEDMLADDQIDAVVICTRNDTHASLAIAALQANKHVFVEKPLAISYEEAMKVDVAAKASNKTCQVGFVRRFSENTKLVKELIEQGELGTIYYAKATHIRRAGNPGGWFAKKELSGGGPLIDLGIHLLDVCWYLMGKPNLRSIAGNTYNKLGTRENVQSKHAYKSVDDKIDVNDIEDMVNALIRFDNDASFMLDVSYSLHAKEDYLQIELFGTKGGVVLEPELAIATEYQDSLMNVTPVMDNRTFHMQSSFEQQVNSFTEHCLRNEQSEAPIEDGVKVMQMIDGIYRSAAKGQEVYFINE